VAYLQAGLTTLVIRVWFSSDGATHLTREAVSVEYERPNFLGDRTFEGRNGNRGEKKILARFQVTPVVVG